MDKLSYFYACAFILFFYNFFISSRIFMTKRSLTSNSRT